MDATHPIRERTAQTRDGPGARIGSGMVSAGSVLAAVGAASCCVVPFALASVGISGAWIGSFTALAPYQPYFLGLAVLLLAAGFFVVYRRPRVACAEGTYCARPASRLFTKIALWAAAVIVALAAAFPYAAPRLFDL
jgi:mercuric ion transport protein